MHVQYSTSCIQCTLLSLCSIVTKGLYIYGLWKQIQQFLFSNSEVGSVIHFVHWSLNLSNEIKMDKIQLKKKLFLFNLYLFHSDVFLYFGLFEGYNLAKYCGRGKNTSIWVTNSKNPIPPALREKYESQKRGWRVK